MLLALQFVVKCGVSLLGLLSSSPQLSWTAEAAAVAAARLLSLALEIAGSVGSGRGQALDITPSSPVPTSFSRFDGVGSCGVFSPLVRGQFLRLVQLVVGAQGVLGAGSC